MRDLKDYNMREHIMYAATMALNNLTMYGRVSGDWGVHSIGHVLSVLYDVPHGASLSIAYPAWMRLNKEKAGFRIIQLGHNLFGSETEDQCIGSLEAYFNSINSPIRLSQTSYGEYNKQEIIDTMIHNGVSGAHYKMSADDYDRLVDLMW